jgi:hypothetical protein
VISMDGIAFSFWAWRFSRSVRSSAQSRPAAACWCWTVGSPDSAQPSNCRLHWLSLTSPIQMRPSGPERSQSGVGWLAMAIGPSVGGILVDTCGWRSLFWVILPVATITGALGMARSRKAGARSALAAMFDHAIAVITIQPPPLTLQAIPRLSLDEPFSLERWHLVRCGARASHHGERHSRDCCWQARSGRPSSAAKARASCHGSGA